MKNDNSLTDRHKKIPADTHHNKLQVHKQWPQTVARHEGGSTLSTKFVHFRIQLTIIFCRHLKRDSQKLFCDATRDATGAKPGKPQIAAMSRPTQRHLCIKHGGQVAIATSHLCAGQLARREALLCFQSLQWKTVSILVDRKMAVSQDFSQLTLNLLKVKCGEYGLKKSGKKADLVAR